MKKLLILILILLFNCATTKYIEPVKNTTWKVLSNKYIQRYGSSICIFGYIYCDATRDAILFAPEQNKLDPLKWHAWKNGALIFLFSGAGLKGLEIGQGHISLWQSLKRTVKGEAPISFIGWQYRFHYIKYSNAFDYSMSRNSHRYMIPFLGKDRYIKLNETQMIFVDLNFLIIGVRNLIKY